MAPPGPKQSFLFVNKDSSSHGLTQSSDTEKTSILSHVQQRRRRNARANRPRAAWLEFMGEIEPADSPPSASSAHSTPAYSSHTIPSEISISTDQDRALSLTTHTPRDNGTDPFYATAVGDLEALHYNLHICVVHTSDTTWLAESFAPQDIVLRERQPRHHQFLEDRLRTGVHNAMLMHANLLLGSSIFVWTTGSALPGQTIDHHLIQTLSAVRGQLTHAEKRHDRWTLVAIAVLSLTDMWRGVPEHWTRCPPDMVELSSTSLESGKMHLAAAISLIETTSSWSQVDSYILESLIITDKYLAIATESAPMIPLSGELIHRRLSLRDAARLPMSSSLDLFRHDLLSGIDCDPMLPISLPNFCQHQPLRQTIEDFNLCIYSATNLWKYGDVGEFEETFLWLEIQRVSFDLTTILTHDLTARDRCICITLVILLNLSTHHFGGLVLANILATRLKTVLLQNQVLDSSEDEITLWLWFFCMGSMAETSEVGRSEAWFLPLLVDYHREQHRLPDVEHFIDIFGKLVYFPDRLQSRLILLTDRIRDDLFSEDKDSVQ